MVTDLFFHRILGIPYRLHVVSDVNPKRKPTFVLIHGIGSTGAMWNRIIPKITKNVRVITVDLLGFGDSPKPAWSKYNARQHAAALVRTLRNRKVSGDIIIVGHSLGALVAVEFASRYKKGIKRLILCSPPFYQPPAIRTSRFIAKDDAYRKLYGYMRNNPSSIVKISRLLNQYLRIYKHIILNDATLPAYVRSLEASIENQNSLEKMKKLTIPVDIIYGTFDLLLVKRNLKYVRKHNTYVTLFPVAAGHEVAGSLANKLLRLINSKL